jgi:hypothetical protein
LTHLSSRNPELLSRLVPFAVATDPVRERLDLQPFGQTIAPDHLFDPLHGGSAFLLERLGALDRATFGPGEMAMPRWILLDGAGLSGAIIGLALDAKHASAGARELLGIESSQAGPLPYSMYIAIPSFEADTWVGHNLASLAARRPAGENLRGLGSLTKALALRALGASRQLGAAQWDSVALKVHTRMGPLQLLTAWTPAHTKPATFTYRAQIDEDCLRHLAGDPGGRVSRPEAEEHLRTDDHQAMQALQRRIESGERWCIAGPPETRGAGAPRVPLARMEAIPPT